MNSHEEFLELFKCAISRREYITLASHLEDNWKLLTIVSTEHCEFIVSTIFDPKDGLLYFLNDEFENRSSSKNPHVDNALKHGFAFLEFCIKNFHKTSCFPRYINKIKDVCISGLTKKTTQYILKNACKAFATLIELFGNDERLELTEIVEHFACNFYIYDLKERRWIFFVLGKIIKHKSDIDLPSKCKTTIFQQLYCDAFQEHKLQDVPPMEFHKYFDVLLDILNNNNFQPPDKMRERLFSVSYKWIKHLSRQNNQEHGKMAKESGITLLSSHVEFFQRLVYNDYKHWYDVLRRLSRENRLSSAITGQRALKTFYRVIGRILTEQNIPQNKSILLYFQQEFQTVLKDTNLDSITLQLTIYGFSQMAAPCRMYFGESNVREMYSMITSYVLPLCFNEQSSVENIEKICHYQEELSAILCEISDVTSEKINVLVKVSICTIKRFPEVDNRIVVSSLIKTICKLGSINKNLLQRYLNDIISDGIAWSCSHTLAVDAELQRELNNLEQTPICYKNYLPLWTTLLDAEKFDHRQDLVQLVANTLMDVCVNYIDRLDLRVKQTEEHTALSDVALTHSAVNQTDFRVFTNLVDLYVDVIDKSEPSLFINIVHKFLHEIVRFSHKYPLISGFYSLARVGMKIFTACVSEEEEEEEEKRNERTWQTRELLSNYVIHTLDMIPAFSNIQLLVACLHLILNAPLTYVENVLPRTLPMFKIAFAIGLSNLELAYTALVALKTWTIATGGNVTTTMEKRERTNELVRELVPYLEPYLRSTESSVDVSQNLTTLMARKRAKRVDVIDTERTLRNFQRQVLLFLGSLDHDLLSDFAYDRASRSTGASWDHKDLIRYVVPFPNEIRPKIYFDGILPIVMRLARESSDRRTKIAACEVLHSLVALVAGTTKQNSNDENYLAVYDDLCPTVLALGCDGDEVVRNLYRPLALQLMHWLSSIPKLTNSVIDHLLDSLTDNLNPAMREFAGMCLAEFTDWSIRQESAAQTQSNQLRKIIQKINNLALHPSANKRIAAAVAFNHLYRILREDDDVVSNYWLEIFYCFVRSLDGCDDLSITNALAHIEKVIEIKADLLNDTDDDREKPSEFDKPDLTHALYWLLSRCGVLNERCRAKCMELYVNISRYIGSTARETTQTYVDTYGRDRLCDIILKDLTSCAKDISLADNVMSLLKALDYYVWLMEKQLLPVETLFPANEDHTIFSCIGDFAQQFLQTIREPSTVTPVTKLFGEFKLRELQCKALMATFNFLQVLLNVDVNILPESLWTESLCELIVQCVMCPRTIGFDVKNIEMTDRLPCVLEALLNSMKARLVNLPNNIARCLRSSQESLAAKFRDLHEIAQNSSEIEMTQKVNGLMLLKRCDMLAYLEMSEFCENEDNDDVVVQIFQFLVSNRLGEFTCRDLTASMDEYLQILMEFRLSLIARPADVRSMINTLVKQISNDVPIISSSDSAKIAHGDYFLNKFKSVIFNYILTHRDAIASVFEEVSRNNPDLSLKWIEDLVLFLKRHRRELQTHVDETVNIILRQFTCLKKIVDNVDSRRERLLNIYGTTVRLVSKPTEITEASRELYEWILDQLTRNDSFEYKMLILRNFLVCLTDATDRDNDKIELWGILQQTLSRSRNLISEPSATNVMTMINSFETLLVLLLATKSVTTLRCVIHFAAGAGDRLFDEKLKEYLHRYYRESSSEHVLRSLEETYRAFMNGNTEAERLDVLRGFLLPSFEFCDTVTIESFFERNVRELHEIAEQRTDNDNDNSVKRVIVSKIGYFQLMTIMFSRIDKNKIDDMNSSIVTGNKTFSCEVFRNTWNTRGLRITRPDCDELARRLHCAAYNCSLAIICLKEEERFYKAAFCSQGSDFIWENLVDCKKFYQLGQTFEKKPKDRKITVHIKSAMRVETCEYTYIHSYDLSTCTLSEDINAYDFNRCDLLPSNSQRSVTSSNSFDSSQSHGATSIILESDNFNEHECMPYIYVLLQRVKNLFGSNNEEPEWLKFFFNGCLAPSHPNIQLFLLKIVWNAADVFKPHAKFALTPVVKITANYLEQQNLNYIVTDILEMLMDWRDTVTPDENDKPEIQKLFEIVVEKVVNKESSRKSDDKYICKYNINLVRNMVEKWRGCLQMPNGVQMNEIMKAPNVAVNLILSFLQNDMTELIVATDDVVEFLLDQLDKWETSKRSEMTCLLSCECLGLCLKFIMRNETGTENKGRELQQRIVVILGASEKPLHYMIKQIKRIAHLCRACPDLAVNYVCIAISAMAKDKSHCLEIFFLAMPKIDAIGLVDYLHNIRLERILENPICEKMALHIVHRMVTIVSPTVLFSYIKLVIRYIRDNIAEHRKLVYDVLVSVHKKYSVDIAANDDATVQDLMFVSTQNLLAGLIDSCPDLQEKILKFWTEETELSRCSPKDRLITLLDMYSSQVTTMPDNVFASFVGLLMLQLTTQTRDYTKKMFEQPLHSNSPFENYKVPNFQCRQNLSSVAPIFVDSLASQINQLSLSSYLSQSCNSAATSVYSRASFGYPLRLRATQDSRFEQTLMDEDKPATATFDIASLDTEFNRIRQPRPTTLQGKASARFLANSLDVAHYRRKQIQKNEQRAEMIKQENVRQQSSVRLYRDYRIGDFPDIQIPHSSLIVPLQQLIKLDRLICKDVTVSLLCALIEDVEETEGSDDFSQTIVEKLKQILQKSSERSSSFSAIILETLLKLRVVDCNPRDVMKISKINGLDTLGTLLLEQSLLLSNDDSVSPIKRMRRQDDDVRNEETNKWAQLAFLYKSLNDVDVVSSIFRERQSFGQHIQEAALAAASGNWIQAKHAFEMGCEQTEIFSMKEHCVQGLFEAVNNLCDWSAIDRLVKSRTNRDLNNIWNDSWKDWMIPYVSDAYTYMYGMGEVWSSRDSDMKVIESWMNDRDKMAYLKSTIGENLLMSLLRSYKEQKVIDLLNDLLDKTAEQWVGLNPLCAELGIRNLQKLQAISDLDASLKVLRCTDETDRVDRLADLLNFWSTKSPTIRDNLIQWNKLVAFRLFSSLLIEELMDDDDDCHVIDDDNDDDDCRIIDDDNDDNGRARKHEVVEQMRRAGIQLRLDVGDAALNQNHRYIAEKYLNCMIKIKGVRYLNMEVPLTWFEARAKSLRADLESDAEIKMSAYTDSWKCSHELLSNGQHMDGELCTAFKQHIGVMASKIESYSRENDRFASELTKNTVILRKIRNAEATNVDLDTVRRDLLRYSSDMLRMCCEDAETTGASNVGEHYCALAKHCYNRLTTTDVESDEIFRCFMSSTLKSMRYGYLEATHYFPCLLKPEHLRYEQTRQIFDRECAVLQPWLFLRWRDLLFSHLNTSIADAVAPIVERLAETYPDAVIYNYLAIERTPDIRQQKLRSLLGSKATEYEQFLEAIRCVTQPELYLKYHLDEAVKEHLRGEVAAFNSLLLQRIHPIFGSQVANRNNPRLGKVYQQFADCVRKIENINRDNPDDLRRQVQEIKQSLDKSLNKRLEKISKRGAKVYNSQLKNYSPFLHNYTGGNILEIPGQYSGNKEPIPCCHVKIARFEPDVAIMPSLRKPIRISMIGDNGREYKFLIKFGEDLTIDRGLQQLYATMSRTLRNDASCSQRHLDIDTYEVIPLSRSLGLIQWIEGTRSLEEFVEFSMKSKDTENHNAIRRNYKSWIADAAPPMSLEIDGYKEAISKYGQQTVAEKMKHFIGITKQTALRDTFAAIGTSPECFVTLRRNFVTSYATMCAAHWIAGIGDRNLQNTLVRVATGRCLGIDFGHSFGSGIRAPIPELVPFRLTPQILELLRPFTERDLMATIMTHAMRALRNDRGPILACMDIFIHKPAGRSLNDEMTRENIDTDSTWSSKKNIEVVVKKLNGIHPSLITLEQLKETHNNRYLARYEAIVTGNDEFRQTRADKRNDCLTPAEQVDCLLDQAKDLNILGRMYTNWQPWL